MRPGAVVDDVRKMRVQGKGEESCGTGLLVGRCLRQGGVPHVRTLWSGRPGRRSAGPV